MVDELRHEAAQVLAGAVELVEPGEDARDVAAQDGLREVLDERAGDEAEDAEDVLLLDLPPGEGDDLVERGLGVAHAAVGAARDGEERVLGDLDALRVAHLPELPADVALRDLPEVEALAAREDRAEDLVRLGRREDELHELGRLLERLQQRVERRRREHVDLVDVEDAELALDRRVLDLGEDALVDVLDLVVRGAVDLDHVERRAAGDGPAGGALPAGVRGGAVLAVEGLGEDAGEGGLAGAAGAGEEVGLRDAALLDRGAQRADDVVLPDDLLEGLRAPFAGDDFV